MKSQLFTLTVSLFVLVCSAATLGNTDQVDWQAFSQNLTEAIESDNTGLQQSAMCMIIRYADQLTIPRDAVFEIVKVFRKHSNVNVRLLALVTLHKIEDPWAMDYLKRHRRFEKETRVKQLCCCAVKSYYAKMDSLKSDKADKILVQAADEIVQYNLETASDNLDIEQYGF